MRSIAIRYLAPLALTTALAAPAPAMAACKVGMIAQLSVTMQGLRAVVESKINGQPAPFILDSGAFYSTISPPVAKALHLPEQPLPPGFTVRGIGGVAESWATTVRHFELAGADIPNVQFIVGGSEAGQTGLLGQNVLGLADVEYDLPGGAVRLFRPQGCGKLAMAYWTDGKPFFELPIEDKETSRSHTMGAVMLEGAKMRAMFDTGAPTTVVSLRAAARAGVKPGDPGVVESGWSSGLGKRVVRDWIATFKKLEIGNEELHNVRLHIADMGGLDTDMLIGADYFISHRIFVSNAQRRMYFTYTGGRLFSSAAHVDATSQIVAQGAPQEAPKDAEGYSQRGAMYQTQKDLPHAIEAFTKAMELAPKDPRYPRQRAFAYLAQRRPILALDDLNTTLTLDPADTQARLVRAEIRLRAGNPAGAISDLDDVSGRLPREDGERLRVAQLYSSADAFPAAIAQFDLWLAVRHQDAHQSAGQNGRCWARALANIELDQAKRDCDAAVRAIPNNPNFLDSRALVAFRRGDYSDAVTDYTAALATSPRMAWALYCRGLAERHLGKSADADRDIAAALAIEPKVAERAKRYHLE